MARPIKDGVDYFPLDVSLDEKFQLIEAEFGLDGFAVVVKLYQRIYGGHGYYCEWNDEVALLFSRQCGLGGKAVSEIVSAAIRRGIFDAQLCRDKGILTSPGIQKRYLEATVRRKVVSVRDDYLLVPADILSENVVINRVNVSKNSKNARNNPQSKEEKSKGKESKSKRETRPYAEYVHLTEVEYQRLESELGETAALKAIEILNGYKGANGKKYKDDNLAIRNWVIDRIKKDHPGLIQAKPATINGNPYR